MFRLLQIGPQDTLQNLPGNEVHPYNQDTLIQFGHQDTLIQLGRHDTKESTASPKEGTLFELLGTLTALSTPAWTMLSDVTVL